MTPCKIETLEAIDKQLVTTDYVDKRNIYIPKLVKIRLRWPSRPLGEI